MLIAIQEELNKNNSLSSILIAVYWILYVLLMGFWTKDCVPEHFIVGRLAAILHLHPTQITNSRQWLIPVISMSYTLKQTKKREAVGSLVTFTRTFKLEKI